MNTPNFDTKEIHKFDQLAASWWDKQGEFKTLHEINPLRLNFIEEKANGLKGKSIIDVGCGGGILAESMAVRGAIVSGIDMAPSSLKVAKLHAAESGVFIEYQQTTVEALATTHAENFDIVTCMELLEHVPDPLSVIQACAKLCKPGGQVFFSTINRNPKAYLFAIVGAEYLLRLLPKGTHDYAKFIKPAELAGWCRQADLTVQQLAGISYNPFSKKYTLSKNIQVNYLLQTVKGII